MATGIVDRSSTFVKILEEPAAKALRFRYECEGRSAGSLPGANSTHDKKTFPKIQVISSEVLQRGVVVVSCVTVDPPYRPHPHNLVGKEGFRKGVCTMEICCNENGQMICEFSNLGIQCVKKKDIEDSLKIREEIRVDPFRTGFGHKSQPGSIDLNAVRLCFQVFLEGPERGQFKIPLKPIVSEAIYDKKAINDLTIMKLSDCTSPVLGNKEIILLCDKVSKDDIEIRFYEENDQGQVIWEALGDFQPSDVHKQYAICFRTPPFRDLETVVSARVNIQLRCPSKETTSVPRPFDYLPLSSGKLWKLSNYDSAYEDNQIQNNLKFNKSVEHALATEDQQTYQALNQALFSEHNSNDIQKVNQEYLEGIYDVDLDFINRLNGQGQGQAIGQGQSQGQGQGGQMGQSEISEEPMEEGEEAVKQTSEWVEQSFEVNNVTDNLSIVNTNLAIVTQNIQNNESTPPPRPPKSPLLPQKSTNPPVLPPKKSPTSPSKKPGFFKNLFNKNTKSPNNQNANTKNVTTKKATQNVDKISPEEANSILEDLDGILETENAENYALYMDNCPKATVSEFDEMSLLYCPVSNNNK